MDQLQTSNENNHSETAWKKDTEAFVESHLLCFSSSSFSSNGKFKIHADSANASFSPIESIQGFFYIDSTIAVDIISLPNLIEIFSRLESEEVIL